MSQSSNDIFFNMSSTHHQDSTEIMSHINTTESVMTTDGAFQSISELNMNSTESADGDLFLNETLAAYFASIFSSEWEHFLTLVVSLNVMVSICGMVSNVMNMVVYRRSGLKEGMNIGFFALAFSDFTVAALCFVCAVSFLADKIYPRSDIDALSLVYISGSYRGMFFGITSSTTGFLSIERCVCVMRPFKVKAIFTRWRCIVILMLIYLFNLVTYLPIFLSVGLSWQYDYRFNKTRLLLVTKFSLQIIEIMSDVINGTLVTTVFQIVVVTCGFVLMSGLRKSNRFRKVAAGVPTPKSLNSHAVVSREHETTISRTDNSDDPSTKHRISDKTDHNDRISNKYNNNNGRITARDNSGNRMSDWDSHNDRFPNIYNSDRRLSGKENFRISNKDNSDEGLSDRDDNINRISNRDDSDDTVSKMDKVNSPGYEKGSQYALDRSEGQSSRHEHEKSKDSADKNSNSIQNNGGVRNETSRDGDTKNNNFSQDNSRCRIGTIRDCSSENNNLHQHNGRMTQKDTKLVRMVAILVAIHVTCTTPGLIYSFVRLFVPELNITTEYIYLYKLLYFIVFLFEGVNGAVNLLVYYNTSSRYRIVFQRSFCSCRHRA